MTCGEVEPRLGEWLCAALDEELEERLGRHLEGCAACRAAAGELRRLEERLGAAASTPAVTSPWRRRAVAAAAVVVAGAAAFLATGHRERDGDDEIGGVDFNTPAARPAAVLHLAEGGLVHTAEGADCDVVDACTVELRAGRIEVDARGAPAGVTVHVAGTRVQAKDAVYTVGVEDVMKSKIAVAAVTTVSVGVVVGSVYLFSGDAAPVELEEGQTAVVTDDPEAGDARAPSRTPDTSHELLAARRRVAELEAELKRLKGARLEAQSAVKEATARNEELTARVKELEERMEKEGDGDNGLERGPKAVAAILGLESSREEALERAWNRTNDAARELEKRFAEITRDGEHIQIHIPPHPKEWGAVMKRFDDDLGMILTPAERERYAELGLRKNLFDGPDGTQDRRIELGPHENGYQRKETATRGGSKSVTNGVFGGEDGKEEALEGYRYLLEK